MSINIVEASFNSDNAESRFYSRVLTFCHRKDDYMSDIYVLLYSEEDEFQSPDLCLCSCSLDLKDAYRNYLRTKEKKQFLLNDKSCLIKTFFFSRSPAYHKLFSETVELIESGISLKSVTNKKIKYFRWIEFDFTFEGTNIFIDCSLRQVENKAFEKILENWNIFLNNIIKRNKCLEKIPSNYEISFKRSIWEFMNDIDAAIL